MMGDSTQMCRLVKILNTKLGKPFLYEPEDVVILKQERAVIQPDDTKLKSGWCSFCYGYIGNVSINSCLFMKSFGYSSSLVGLGTDGMLR